MLGVGSCGRCGLRSLVDGAGPFTGLAGHLGADCGDAFCAPLERGEVGVLLHGTASRAGECGGRRLKPGTPRGGRVCGAVGRMPGPAGCAQPGLQDGAGGLRPLVGTGRHRAGSPGVRRSRRLRVRAGRGRSSPLSRCPALAPPGCSARPVPSPRCARPGRVREGGRGGSGRCGGGLQRIGAVLRTTWCSLVKLLAAVRHY